jgi:hypothetical protein
MPASLLSALEATLGHDLQMLNYSCTDGLRWFCVVSNTDGLWWFCVVKAKAKQAEQAKQQQREAEVRPSFLFYIWTIQLYTPHIFFVFAP